MEVVKDFGGGLKLVKIEDKVVLVGVEFDDNPE